MALDPLAPVRFGFRVGIGVLRFELRVLEQLLGLDRAAEPDVAEPRPEPQRAGPVPIQREAEPQVVREPVAPAPRTPEPEPEAPAHVDTETELVAEFAEPGAEEGAGPEIHVDEPWDGYSKMAAADIRDRVAVAGPEALAVVQLYETANRGRRTVLDAVERRSKELANAPSAR